MEIDICVGDLEREFLMETDVAFSQTAKNNNATVGLEQVQMSALGPRPSCIETRLALLEFWPSQEINTEESSNLPHNKSGVQNMMQLMQQFMLSKGLINPDMNSQEIHDFITKEMSQSASKKTQETNDKDRQPLKQATATLKTTQGKGSPSMSEATVYRKAVRQLNPELEIQIDNLLNKSRLETEVTLPHKISYSSDENMDTSDETVDIDTGWERLIRSHLSARFCFELSGNSN